MIIDDFIDSYAELRKYADTAIFKTEKNPADGVEYPLICKEIPSAVRQEIVAKLSKIANAMVNVSAMFMRLSPEGVHVPHIAHTDNSMGRYSLMLYLCDNDNAGTSFLRHRETGITYAPESQACVDIVTKDQNNLDAWACTGTVAMKQNRAFIFDAANFHCAEPVGGFGQTQKDARLVLTAFFS